MHSVSSASAMHSQAYVAPQCSCASMLRAVSRYLLPYLSGSLEFSLVEWKRWVMHKDFQSSKGTVMVLKIVLEQLLDQHNHVLKHGWDLLEVDVAGEDKKFVDLRNKVLILLSKENLRTCWTGILPCAVYLDTSFTALPFEHSGFLIFEIALRMRGYVNCHNGPVDNVGFCFHCATRLMLVPGNWIFPR